MKRRAMAALLLATSLCGPARADEKIVFATDWNAEAEHGGFYQALARGFYKRRGLEVTIRQGGPGIDNQRLLAAGAVDLAIGSNDFFALNLLAAGAKARAVAAIFQKDPLVLMTHQRPDIHSIADMKGKPIMVADFAIGTFWAWLKARYGFQDSQIRKYTFNMAPWLVNQDAIQQGYVTAEPYLAEQAGARPQVYLLADDGYPSYATLILASDRMIAARPAVVQAFVDASIEGWRDYLGGDPSPGNALIKRANPDETDGLIAFAVAQMRQRHLVDGGDARTLGVGAMTDARWRAFFDVMAAQRIYPATLDWRQAYTRQFLHARK